MKPNSNNNWLPKTIYRNPEGKSTTYILSPENTKTHEQTEYILLSGAAREGLPEKIAGKIKENYSVGNSGGFCDEWEWDDADLEDISDVIREVINEI